MANSIGGNGGIDSSSLDQLLSQLNNILDKQSEINSTRIKPKSDDSEIKKISKSIEELRDEAKNTSRTNLELWNTNALKKQVGEAKRILGELSKSFDISKISPENVSGFEKEFLKAFATIKAYSEKYGQEISAEYQNIFNSIFKKSDVFKQDDLQEIFQKGLRAASESVKKGSWDIQFEANENWVQEQKKIYEEQAQAARESANAVKEAEKQKQEALMNTRDELVKGVKAQLEEMKSSGEGGFLEIDYDQWGKFQKSAGDMIQTLAEMGVEVRGLEDLLDSISKKVYLPKDQLGAIKQGSITDSIVGDASELDKTQQKVDELYNEIARLQNVLYNSPTNEAFDEVNKDYEEARQEVERLKIEIEDLNSELRYSVDYWSWNQKIEEIERLEKEIDELKNKLKSTGNGSGDGLSDEISKGFNSEELSSFLNILEKIEEQLRNISSTLGTVDENSGFNNMISSIDVLLSKLDEMHKKIGTGIYNINVNQGSDETTFAQDESVKSYIRDTQNRYKSAYDKVVKKAGGEELLFTRINNILNTGIDQLNEAYSSINVSKIESKEQQVYRLMDFFKILRQAMSDENFGLDLKGVRLPSSNDENFRRSIRNKSGETERRKQQRARESLLSDEPEETLPGLNQITQALERIEILITEISQKDLFGDSLSKVSEQLDEIATKFDSIVSDVRVINEDPIAISNQTPVSSDTDDIDKATNAIKEEGNAAKKSAEQKEEFVLANQKVAESGVETADGIKKATDAIKEEGKVVSENKIDTSQFESMIKISDTLRERLGGVVDVYRQVQKDSEGEDKISYRLVGENGSAWVGANGDILKEQIKTSEELTRQRKEEKEATRQAVEAERERQSLYKQMQKASSDKQSAQEKQRQSEINTLLSEQKNAYQKVWDIRKQIVKLDPDKNTEEISELEKQKQLALEIYAERTKELKSIDEIANSEAQNNTLLQMRQKALNEIAIIEAKLRDRGVVSDQPSPKDDTTKYTNLLARREIQQGNLDAAKIRNDQTAIKYSQERISALNNEIEALEKLGNIDKEVAEQNLKNEIARINASEKVAKAEDAQAKQRTVNLNRQSKMIKDFSLWLSKNGVAAKAYSNEIELIFNQLQQQGELTAEQLNKVQHEINNIMATAAREGKTGVTFIETLQQRFKSLAAYLASFASFYDVIRYVREGIDIVRQYDTALTEMRKVSDESLSTLKDYASTTFDVGDAVGATALTVQNSTADWMRLGEAINEAQESAKVSNILLNVSEFENIDDATTSLVAMSQAYRDIDKMDIIDKLNNIGNNFSISTDKLAQGLQNAAAVLQTQGNSIDESIALITAANSQVQDISKASGGIRTISLRISGTEEAKAELEDLGEDVEDYIVQTSSKTQETIKNFTAVASNMGKGIDVLDANGNLRNTYDILLDISKIYKEIQEEDKKAGTNRANALVEYLAGKNRANIAASILNAPDLLENVYKASQQSEGSAQQELDKYLDSIDGKLTQTQNHLQELANVTINSDSLKTMLDILNSILPAITGIVDNVGLLQTALIGLAGVQGARGAGLIYKLRCISPCYG